MEQNNIVSENIIIRSFLHDKEDLILNNENNIKYLLKIKDGTIKVIIKNCQGEEVGINYLEEGDVVKIKGYKIDKNKIIIKKIYIKTKYIFNSESSDDFELY